ncbi:MBL fold metallo-hydrolase [Acidilobus sp.]|uniref:MBL fold metallo-hydrolase n=1 Tax=Acidilobus sp. TaxID=1872109 RepID=UPI003D08AEEF
MTLSTVKGSTFLEKGSPATLFYTDRETGTVYVVDPGQGEDRPRALRRDLEKLGAGRKSVLVTHYHSDHLSALGELQVDEIAMSSLDAPVARNPELRVVMTFGYPVNPGDKLLTFHGPPIKVDVEIPPERDSYGPLKLVRLPGHTDGQVGAITPDGVFYVADALFGDRVLEKYGVPYHRMPCAAERSLRTIEELEGKVDFIVPSHGPLIKASDAGPFIEANIRRIEETEEVILNVMSTSATIEDIVAALLKKFKYSELTPDVLMLLEATVKGYIRCLRDENAVEVEVGERGLSFRVSAKPSTA